MLEIDFPGKELYSNQLNEFYTVKPCHLQLEHSLISLSEWESKWKKPFYRDKGQMSRNEFLDYIRCMTITKGVDPMLYQALSREDIQLIQNYIDDPMTATWFAKDDKNSKISKDVITAEIVYYWMIINNIPFECRKWHLNRLLTLIKVCSIKNAGEKKMSQQDVMKQNHQLNKARRGKR